MTATTLEFANEAFAIARALFQGRHASSSGRSMTLSCHRLLPFLGRAILQFHHLPLMSFIRWQRMCTSQFVRSYKFIFYYCRLKMLVKHTQKPHTHICLQKICLYTYTCAVGSNNMFAFNGCRIVDSCFAFQKPWVARYTFSAASCAELPPFKRMPVCCECQSTSIAFQTFR